MKLKLGLKNKMQLFLTSLSVIIYAVAIGYISFNAKKTTYKDSIELVKSNAEKFAYKIQADLNEHMAVVRTLSNVFSVYEEMPWEEWEPLYLKMLKTVYKDNPAFYKIWDSWELNKIDSSWTLPYGRISSNFARQNGAITYSKFRKNLDGDFGLYADIKAKSREMVMPIYFDRMTLENEEKQLMSSLLSPMIINGEYHGIVGIDLILKDFQKITEEISIKQLSGTYAFLMNQDGKYVSHPESNLLNKNVEFTLESGEQLDLLKRIEKKENFDIFALDSLSKVHYVAFSPIQIGRTETPWFIGISVPLNSIMAQADRNFMISLVVGVIGILIISLVIYIVTKNISDPIQKITDFLKELANGKTDQHLDLNLDTGDEIEEMTYALKTSVGGLNKKTEFANHIESGDLEYNFDILSDEDMLGKALVEMRDSLKKARSDEEKRKIEDEKRRWVNEGLAKFADILRQNNDDINELSHEIIKNLIYYLEANQGGLFLINDDDKSNVFLDLVAAFAFDRKKHIEKRIDMGDGIVGAVAMEKLTTYIEDLPDDYIHITSGLGGANPSSLIVVPLKMEDKVYGVIEIASFKKIEEYQKEFLEMVAEDIAATLSSVKTNIETTELLEKFQQQSEEMAAQEEEMRQNMEELQATQEEASRKSIEMESFMSALEESSCIVEYDTKGIVTKVNDNYLNTLKLRRDEVLGTHHTDKMKLTQKQKSEYDKFWNDLNSGQTKKEKSKYRVDGKELLFIEVYTPILDENGNTTRILKISNELTEFDD